MKNDLRFEIFKSNPKNKRILCLVDQFKGHQHHQPWRRLHTEYVSKLYKYYDFKLYGPKEHIISPHLAPIEYDNKITIKDLIDKFSPDIIIGYTKVLTDLWFPKGHNNNVPIIFIESDYSDIEDKAWYKRNNISLIIQRAYYGYDSFIDTGVESVWHPLAATNEFYTDPTSDYLKDRINNIVFMGCTFKYRYEVRRQAISILENNNLLNAKGIIGYEDYPIELKKYISALTCTLSLGVAVGKVFEIMASGTALLTQKMNGREILFGKDQCFFTFKDDMSDIVDVANEILNDKDKVKEVTGNALKMINKHHLEKHRLLELCDIIDAVISGKEIPKKWRY